MSQKTYHERMEKGEMPETTPIEQLESPMPESQPAEEQLADTEQEVTSEETVAPQPAEVQQPLKSKEPSQSWKDLRAQKEKAEKERDEAIRYAMMLQEKQVAKNPTAVQQIEETEDDIHINPDDLVEGKHFAKMHKEMKKLKQELHQYQRQSNEMTVEARLRSQYPDIEKVVNEENIAQLKQKKPALFASIEAVPDLYAKAEAVYELIKQYGIYVEDNYMAEKAAAIKNVNKPKPLASIAPQKGDTPLSHANAFANGLTPELQAQLLKEMNQYRKEY